MRAKLIAACEHRISLVFKSRGVGLNEGRRGFEEKKRRPRATAMEESGWSSRVGDFYCRSPTMTTRPYGSDHRG